MPDADAERFRKQAEQVRQHAIDAPLEKEAWLKLAEEWMKLAQSIGDRG
jgi:hypothetical protein